MKKIGKIIISPEKVIKNEELVNLRGGDYNGELCHCSTAEDGLIGTILLPANCSTSGCTNECNLVFGSQYPGKIIVGLCKPASY
ncbi:MAG: hypothetical protein ACQERU_09635 [Bacteroidota bacterium]